MGVVASSARVAGVKVRLRLARTMGPDNFMTGRRQDATLAVCGKPIIRRTLHGGASPSWRWWSANVAPASLPAFRGLAGWKPALLFTDNSEMRQLHGGSAV